MKGTSVASSVLVTRSLIALLLIVSCVPAPPRHGDACKLSTDCDPDHVCVEGVCVSSPDAGPTNGATDAMSSDAPPEHAMISIGATDCSSGRCRGGYNGQKDTTSPTADKLCTDHAFARADSFTISNDQPGGRFCSWDATTMQYGCDGSCSGCNAIDMISCTRP